MVLLYQVLCTLHIKYRIVIYKIKLGIYMQISICVHTYFGLKIFTNLAILSTYSKISIKLVFCEDYHSVKMAVNNYPNRNNRRNKLCMIQFLATTKPIYQSKKNNKQMHKPCITTTSEDNFSLQIYVFGRRCSCVLQYWIRRFLDMLTLH